MAKKPVSIDDDDDLDASPAAISNAINRNLVQFLERLETLAEEKKGIADDMKGVFSEAKGSGFDGKTMRRMLVLRKMENNDRDEMDALEQTYRRESGIPTYNFLDD